MSESDGRIERFLLWISRRSSDRGIVIIAAALYFGLGLAVPLILGWPTSWLIAANVTGTMFAGLVLLTWFVVQIQARDRRHLIEWTSDLRRLDAQEFEWFVGELMRREGWSVEEAGRHGAPDGGIDLIVTRGKERKVVQCKRWTSWQVGVDDIRSFAGTLTRDGIQGSAGIFVTLTSFTDHARDEAERMGMYLWDNRDLHARAEKVRRTEPCPLCSEPMALGRSQHGWWFRCMAAGCQGKRDLGRDPIRAIELLTARPE